MPADTSPHSEAEAMRADLRHRVQPRARVETNARRRSRPPCACAKPDGLGWPRGSSAPCAN